jgi:hypothetical protein
MTPFLASLARDDVAPTTLRGYPYDLRHFLAWRPTVQDCPFTRWIPLGELLIVPVGFLSRSDSSRPKPPPPLLDGFPDSYCRGAD